MENLIKQIRVKLTGAEEENKADLGGTWDQKIPIQNTSSFKEKKKAPNWLQRQFSRTMSHDYDSTEMEHATAIAAAAFAISSQEASEIPQKKKISEPPETSLTRTRSKMDGKKSPISQPSKKLSVSFKITDDQDNKVPISPETEEKKPEKTITPEPSMKKTSTFSEKFKSTDDKKPETPPPRKTPSFGDKHWMNTDDIKLETPEPKVPPLADQNVSLRSPPPPPPPLPPPLPPSPPPPFTQTSRPPSGSREQILTRTSTGERKANVWEREEHKKIKERYEKLLETIDSWERRKKMKARRKLNKQEQSEDERKRAKALRKYQDKMKYIEEIAGGARAQADERRRNEELKAKEKANIIRTTGKLPRGCSCF